MKSKYMTYSLIGLLILFIIIASFKLLVEPAIEKVNKLPDDVSKKVNIDNKELNVTFYDGDVLDISITYGNIYTRELKIDNNTNDDITYSLKLIDSFISNEDISYDLYVAYNDDKYIQAIKDSSIKNDTALVHSLVISNHSSNRIKIVFKSKHENEESIIKGRLSITNNLSTLELFNITLKNIEDAVDDKINKLNGISTKGYYLLNIGDLSFSNDALLKGYVLIDASDISAIKYVYTVYNDKYMIKNNDKNNVEVVNADYDYINSINNNTVCNQYDTRIRCNTSIPKSTNDYKRDFYKKSKELIATFNNEFNKDDDKTYIYNINEDISNSHGLYGYILKNKDDMYLYIRNDLYMISGYNYSKLGDYDIKSSTIRSYVESAFNLSTNDKGTVCRFSGYSECYDKNGNRIGE